MTAPLRNFIKTNYTSSLPVNIKLVHRVHVKFGHWVFSKSISPANVFLLSNFHTARPHEECPQNHQPHRLLMVVTTSWLEYRNRHTSQGYFCLQEIYCFSPWYKITRELLVSAYRFAILQCWLIKETQDHRDFSILTRKNIPYFLLTQASNQACNKF